MMLRNQRNLTIYLKIGLILLVVSYIGSAICSEEKYPRTLTTKQIKAHYTQFTKINADQDGRDFTLTIDDGIALRECFDCREMLDSAVIVFNANENLICFNWLQVSFPVSGCFSLTQTNDRSFTLRELESSTNISYYVSSAPKTVDELSQLHQKTPVSSSVSIRVDLSVLDPSDQLVKTASKSALSRRRWTVLDQANSEIIVGRLVRSSKIYKVKMEYNAPWLDIAFIEGYQTRRKNWLLNLKKDVLAFIKINEQ